MLTDFEGNKFNLADNWFGHVNLDEYKNRPIQYLEVGTHYGASVLSVAKTYGSHPDSKLHCIDIWEDYSEYPEYKGEQQNIYKTFLLNVEKSGDKDKLILHRGYSNLEILKLEDNFFDIIYIDGNHEPESVLEDGVLAFRKLKKGGIMIFDDYGWGGPDLTKRGIDGFLSGFHKRVDVLGLVNHQVFTRKRS